MLVLCGEDDQATPLNFHKVIADNIAGATLITVPMAGHFMTLEQPESVNQHLCDWLNDSH